MHCDTAGGSAITTTAATSTPYVIRYTGTDALGNVGAPAYRTVSVYDQCAPQKYCTTSGKAKFVVLHNPTCCTKHYVAYVHRWKCTQGHVTYKVNAQACTTSSAAALYACTFCTIYVVTNNTATYADLVCISSSRVHSFTKQTVFAHRVLQRVWHLFDHCSRHKCQHSAHHQPRDYCCGTCDYLHQVWVQLHCVCGWAVASIWSRM